MVCMTRVPMMDPYIMDVLVRRSTVSSRANRGPTSFDLLCLAMQEDISHVFVAIVPVVLDSFFKYWIFVGLNRQDPAATVTLKSMDRH